MQQSSIWQQATTATSHFYFHYSYRHQQLLKTIIERGSAAITTLSHNSVRLNTSVRNRNDSIGAIAANCSWEQPHLFWMEERRTSIGSSCTTASTVMYKLCRFWCQAPHLKKKQSMHRPGPFLLKNGCQGRACNTAWIRKQLHHSKKDTKNEHPTWEVAPVLTYGSLGLRFNPKITKICKLDEKKISLGPLLFNDPPETV